MGVRLQLVCAADAAVEEPAGGTCQGGENRPSVWGSPGGPLCQATGKQAQRPLRDSGPVGGKGGRPTPESRAEQGRQATEAGQCRWTRGGPLGCPRGLCPWWSHTSALPTKNPG